MKKILFSILAMAAIAACTKSEIEYNQSQEIGFNIVSGKMTKASVTNTTYPTSLNMYVFAATTTDNTDGSANYINKGEFQYLKVSNDNKNLWAGWMNNAHYPYYWPNVKHLFFAGVSKSGNVASATTAMNFNTNTLSISDYEAGVGTTALGDNDLMWFGKTTEYGRDEKTGLLPEYVHVDMYHACSWITVKLYGDDVTAKDGSAWSIKNITINGLTTKGDVNLNATTANWTLSTSADDINKQFEVFNGTKILTQTATETGYETISNNTIVLPQASTNMDITYSYTSPAGVTITETANVSLALDNSAEATDDDNKWKAGYHYIYTVKVTATEILIQPDAIIWTDQEVTPDVTI